MQINYKEALSCCQIRSNLYLILLFQRLPRTFLSRLLHLKKTLRDTKNFPLKNLCNSISLEIPSGYCYIAADGSMAPVLVIRLFPRMCSSLTRGTHGRAFTARMSMLFRIFKSISILESSFSQYMKRMNSKHSVRLLTHIPFCPKQKMFISAAVNIVFIITWHMWMPAVADVL